LLDEPINEDMWAFKVLNENIRNDLEKALSDLKIENERVMLNKPSIEEALKKHLYPTRDERLEQDLYISTYNIERDGKKDGYDYYIRLGYKPEVLLECPNKTVTLLVKVLNEDIREDVDIFMNEKINEEVKSIHILKDELKKHLYPNDDPTIYVPSWEEEYELKKAIKIERELHSKALF